MPSNENAPKTADELKEEFFQTYHEFMDKFKSLNYQDNSNEVKAELIECLKKIYDKGISARSSVKSLGHWIDYLFPFEATRWIEDLQNYYGFQEDDIRKAKLNNVKPPQTVLTKLNDLSNALEPLKNNFDNQTFKKLLKDFEKISLTIKDKKALLAYEEIAELFNSCWETIKSFKSKFSESNSSAATIDSIQKQINSIDKDYKNEKEFAINFGTLIENQRILETAKYIKAEQLKAQETVNRGLIDINSDLESATGVLYYEGSKHVANKISNSSTVKKYVDSDGLFGKALNILLHALLELGLRRGVPIVLGKITNFVQRLWDWMKANPGRATLTAIGVVSGGVVAYVYLSPYAAAFLYNKVFTAAFAEAIAVKAVEAGVSNTAYVLSNLHVAEACLGIGAIGTGAAAYFSPEGIAILAEYLKNISIFHGQKAKEMDSIIEEYKDIENNLSQAESVIDIPKRLPQQQIDSGNRYSNGEISFAEALNKFSIYESNRQSTSRMASNSSDTDEAIPTMAPARR